jgi:hypothetical protein
VFEAPLASHARPRLFASLPASQPPDYKSWRKRADLTLRGRLTRWRRALTALVLFRSAKGEALLDVFCFWAAEKSSDSADRWEALRKLKTNLLAKLTMQKPSCALLS